MVTARLIICIILINSGFIALVYMSRPASEYHRMFLSEQTPRWKAHILIALVWVTLCCTTPMGLSPIQNGERPGYRNQYELIAEAFLKGQLYFDYEVDEKLAALENPYDGDARRAAGVYYRWDHAFYKGKYYMYFGVVPVILLFLPYRAITGTSLATFHGSQIFAAFFILGVFALFKMLAGRFFSKLTLSGYLSLSIAVSVMSVWQVTVKPALYCTAMISAICMSIWSIYFFVKAVFCTESVNKAMVYAALGSLFGAFEFGCRPTVGLSNVIVLPLLIYFLQHHKVDKKLVLKLVCAALPYVIVAAALMWYNAVRFDNPFEFGQSYQLTVADQSGYGDMLSRIHPGEILEGIRYYLLDFRTPAELVTIGTLIVFPIHLIAVIWGMQKEPRRLLRESGLMPFVLSIPAAVLLIIFFIVVWSPVVAPRYRVDFFYLLGIMSFILLGSVCEASGRSAGKSTGQSIRTSFRICVLAVLTVVASIIVATYPYKGNNSDYYVKTYQKQSAESQENAEEP